MDVEFSEVLKALGDSNRLRIFGLLSKNELCVCILSEVLKTSQPNVSKHLNRLRYSGIIKCRKISQWCFYGIDDKFKEQNKLLYDFILNKLEQDEQYAKDKSALKNLLESKICYQQLLQQDESNK